MIFNNKKFNSGFTPHLFGDKPLTFSDKSRTFSDKKVRDKKVRDKTKFRLQTYEKGEGFTLLEVIFAVTIIVIAVLAIFGLVNLGVKNISVAKNKLIASELAQEGIELARWWREDGHAGDWTDWYDLSCINASYSPTQVCGNFRFSVSSNNPANIDITYNNIWSGTMPRIGTEITKIGDIPSFFQLWYDSSTKLYNYNGNGQSANFFRIINISPPVGGEYKLVTVQVIWQDRATLKSVQVYDKLYNWMAP